MCIDLISKRKEKEEEKLKKAYLGSISQMQKKCVEQLIGLYRHQYIESEINASQFSDLDLEAEETWTKWGLSRNQLAVAGGITGATAGGAIDIGSAGATHGLGALLGGMIGLTTTYFKGGALPNFTISIEDLTGGKRETSSDNEQRKLSVGAPKGENFPWILLDTILVQYHAILKRSHGRRDKQTLKAGLTDGSFVRQMTASRRKTLTQWFDSCIKEKPDYTLEPKVLEAIEIAMMESSEEEN